MGHALAVVPSYNPRKTLIDWPHNTVRKGAITLMKPLIGITPSLMMDVQSHGTFERYLLSSNYSNAVHAAGGVPVILPPQADHASSLLERLDGLLLSGGADIDPHVYGDTEIHSTTYDISQLRDTFEFQLLQETLRRDLPLLCICRGIQVLNVDLGGTLYQDVADQFNAELMHRQQNVGIAASEPSHSVRAQSGGLLEQVYGSSTIETNSFHHQAIKEIAPDLIVEGVTEDGLVEAVSYPKRAFVLGVQWHPEMMYGEHGEHCRPFERLVAAAVAKSLTTV